MIAAAATVACRLCAQERDNNSTEILTHLVWWITSCTCASEVRVHALGCLEEVPAEVLNGVVAEVSHIHLVAGEAGGQVVGVGSMLAAEVSPNHSPLHWQCLHKRLGCNGSKLMALSLRPGCLDCSEMVAMRW